MAPQSLSTNIIYLCGEFSHQFHQSLTKVFKDNRIGVTVEQFSILALLFYRNGLSQQEVSASLSRDKTTIARVISIMERDKMITRIPNKDDSRGKLIYLTTKGESIQKKAVELSGKLYVTVLKNVKDTQLKAGLRLMSTMTDNLKNNS